VVLADSAGVVQTSYTYLPSNLPEFSSQLCSVGFNTDSRILLAAMLARTWG
jgi:hypothetical protein